MDIEELNDCKAKVERLRLLDPDCTVYGSDGHRYLTWPYTDGEIDDLEREHDFKLPVELRKLYTTLGHGAGPGYRVMGIEESLELAKILASSLIGNYPYSGEGGMLKEPLEAAWVTR